MNRIDRLFGILTMLQAKKHVTAEKLAEKFSISIRTVYRDVKALGEGGIPVSFEPAKGYFIVQGFFLPPVTFTSEEANALLLMERMVRGFADNSIYKHYSTALTKVKSVLHSSQKESIDLLDQHIGFQLPPCAVNNFDHLSLLQTSITTKAIVELDYQNKEGVVSNRQVEPVGLVYYAFSWHLFGWCHKREAYRDFRVSRIAKLKTTSISFKTKKHLPLADYIKSIPVEF